MLIARLHTRVMHFFTVDMSFNCHYVVPQIIVILSSHKSSVCHCNVSQIICLPLHGIRKRKKKVLINKTIADSVMRMWCLNQPSYQIPVFISQYQSPCCKYSFGTLELIKFTCNELHLTFLWLMSCSCEQLCAGLVFVKSIPNRDKAVLKKVNVWDTRSYKFTCRHYSNKCD